MNTLREIEIIRNELRQAHSTGRRIGLVPTMGALHEGHRSLLRRARSECDLVVASIFVNPTQFGPGEDYERYPRVLDADLAVCEQDGVDLVFAPSAEKMYPEGCASTVAVARLTETLCGPHRPGHFLGVTTVVAKLFNIVQPTAAYFGQKDAQQAIVIRRVVRDLCWPIEIVVCPIVREQDGLALSSRNAYLSADERRQALSLYGSLCWASDQIAQGDRDGLQLTHDMAASIRAAGPCDIDYVAIVDADDLSSKYALSGRCLIALAVRIGRTRLIDNIVVDVP